MSTQMGHFAKMYDIADFLPKSTDKYDKGSFK